MWKERSASTASGRLPSLTISAAAKLPPRHRPWTSSRAWSRRDGTGSGTRRSWMAGSASLAVAVVSEGGELARLVGEGDQAHLLARGHARDQPAQLLLGQVHSRGPAGRGARAHRCAGVHQHRMPACGAGTRGPEGQHRAEGHQREDGELQPQRQMTTEALEGRVHPLVLEHRAPERQGGHHGPRALELEEVQEHDRHREGGERCGHGLVEAEGAHASQPSRRMRSSTCSRGSAELTLSARPPAALVQELSSAARRSRVWW